MAFHCGNNAQQRLAASRLYPPTGTGSATVTSALHSKQNGTGHKVPCLPIFAPPLDLSFAARVCQGRPRGGVVLRLRLASDGGGRLPGDFAPAESIRDTAEDTCRPRQLRLKWSWIQPGGWAVCSILHQRKVGAKRVGQGRTCEDVRCTPSGCGAGSGSGSGCAHVSALGTGDDSLAAATASPGSAPLCMRQSVQFWVSVLPRCKRASTIVGWFWVG